MMKGKKKEGEISKLGKNGGNKESEKEREIEKEKEGIAAKISKE